LELTPDLTLAKSFEFLASVYVRFKNIFQLSKFLILNIAYQKLEKTSVMRAIY